MNIVKWIAVIVVAYVVGYFSHSPEPVVTPEVVGDCLRLDAFKEVQSALLQDQERMQRLAKANPVIDAKPAASGHEKRATQHSQDVSSQAKLESPIATPEPIVSQMQSSSVGPSNITDEEIDRLVPAPFNEHMKKNPGKLREKLKEFSEATQQDDWDITNQNKITDYLLGNSYSKFIELHSVICKANFCEVRGRELKPNVFGVLFPEMMMQDWWDMAESQWSSGGVEGDVYALFLRRQSSQ